LAAFFRELIHGCRSNQPPQRKFPDRLAKGEALVEVTEEIVQDVERRRRPRYALVPSLRAQRLVVDLDRSMTLEKPVLARSQRVQGCRTDEERRRFAEALARHRKRFAFPDDFAGMVSKLAKRIQEKHDRESDEGRALRALEEIRVRAAPSWDAPHVEVTFWFIRKPEDATFETKTWPELKDLWMTHVKSSGRFDRIQGFVATLDDLTGRDYVESDPLDLDHVSKSDGSEE